MSEGECYRHCRCGHPEPDHDYLTHEELEALTKNDIEWGACAFWDVAPQKISSGYYEGETLYYIWAAFKPGQLRRIAEHVIARRGAEAEDPCDSDFMREISS